jgi:hypothetical protein
VTVLRSPGAAGTSYTFDCAEVADLCAAAVGDDLREAGTDDCAATDAEATATLTGTVGGADVDLAFARDSDCEVERWDRLAETVTEAGAGPAGSALTLGID